MRALLAAGAALWCGAAVAQTVGPAPAFVFYNGTTFTIGLSSSSLGTVSAFAMGVTGSSSFSGNAASLTYGCGYYDTCVTDWGSGGGNGIRFRFNSTVLAQLTEGGLAANTGSASVSAAGTTQATATALTMIHNVVTTCASGAGVILPQIGGLASSSMMVMLWVYNTTANACLVYPPTGSKIGVSGTANAAVSLAAGTDGHYTFVSSTLWLP